jgi:aryl-alcohol dehydrogenase-like predicted oxidoreductase
MKVTMKARLNRRSFLTQSIAAAGALNFAPTFAYAAENARGKFDPFERVSLGKSGLQTSRVIMGTGVRGGNRQSQHTRMGRENCEKLIREAFDRGVRAFDLADLYGTHPFVIPALQKIPRSDFSIISKIWFRAGGIPEKERPDADVVTERFLKELKTDYIDLLLIHCMTSANWTTEMERQMEIMEKLKQKGVIRAHGVSCHSIEALEAAAASPWVDSVHARINPYGTKMDGPAEKVVPVLKKIHAAGKGVVGMKIIGEGDFRNSDEKRDESVKFVVNLGCVDVLNVGFEKISEVDDLAARVRKVRHV